MAHSHSSDTEAPGQAMPELAQGASKGHVSFCLRASLRIPSVIAPCSQATPGSRLPDSLCHSPCPTVCPGWGVAMGGASVSLYELLSGLKNAANLSPLLGSFSLRKPVFLVCPGLSLF